MKKFDPIIHVVGSSTILEPDGTWPSFYESTVQAINFTLEDFGTADAPWIAPAIDVSIEMTEHESPYIVDFKLHNCDEIKMSNFNHSNVIEELSFSFEERGFYADKATPLPPYISVKIGTPNHTVSLTLKCFKVEVLGRREIQRQLNA